jgi:hypothetical protein
MLCKKIRMIEKAHFYLTARVNMLLVCAKEKPTTLLLLNGRKNLSSETFRYEILKERLKETQDLLKKINEPYLITDLRILKGDGYTSSKGEYGNVPDREHIHIYFGQTQDNVEAMEKAFIEDDHKRLGELFGYPNTGTEAYMGLRERYPGKLCEKDSPLRIFCGFIFSQDYFKEEFESTSVRWHDTVQRLSPKMYREIEKRYE